MATFAERMTNAYKTDKETYKAKVEQILNIAKACKDVPVGKRLPAIAAAYRIAGRDAYSGTSCSTTNEVRILSLILDHAGVDTKNLMESEPLLASHYETFKKLGASIDTKELHDVLEPELPMHLQRYGLNRQT